MSGSPTGIYLDTRSNRLNNLKCYDHNGAFVIDPTTAATAVMTNWPGDQYAFDMINLGGFAANPTAWLRFNEGSGTSAGDSSGNGNTGTLVNSPAWVAGETGDALSFNGTNNFVSLGNPADLAIQGGITLAAWVKLQNTSQMSAAIISHGSFNPMGMNTSPSVFLQVGTMGIQVGCVDSTNTIHTASGQLQSGDAGAWVHWAGTYDGTNWTIYRNGQIAMGTGNPTASTVGAVAVNDNWSVGANGAGTANFFNGAIDEARIFNHALSAEEIAVLASPTYLAGRLKTITDRNGYHQTVIWPIRIRLEMMRS